MDQNNMIYIGVALAIIIIYINYFNNKSKITEEMCSACTLRCECGRKCSCKKKCTCGKQCPCTD